MQYVYSSKPVGVDDIHTVFEVNVDSHLIAERMARTLNKEMGWGDRLPGGCFYEKPKHCDSNIYIKVPDDTELWPEPERIMYLSEENIEYKGFTIEVKVDDMPWDPREGDGLGIMFCKHHNYGLGDTDAEDPRTIVTYRPSDFDMKCAEDSEEWAEFICDFDPTDSGKGRDWDEGVMERELIIHRLWIYDHSGISMSTGRVCSWDSSFVGWIYARKDKAKEERMTLEQMSDYMLGEIKMYDAYISGDMYGYTIIDADGKDTSEGCSGWCGWDYKGLIDEAEGDVDRHIIWAEEERVKAAAEKRRVGIISYAI